MAPMIFSSKFGVFPEEMLLFLLDIIPFFTCGYKTIINMVFRIIESIV